MYLYICIYANKVNFGITDLNDCSTQQGKYILYDMKNSRYLFASDSYTGVDYTFISKNVILQHNTLMATTYYTDDKSKFSTQLYRSLDTYGITPNLIAVPKIFYDNIKYVIHNISNTDLIIDGDYIMNNDYVWLPLLESAKRVSSIVKDINTSVYNNKNKCILSMRDVIGNARMNIILHISFDIKSLQYRYMIKIYMVELQDSKLYDIKYKDFR